MVGDDDVCRPTLVEVGVYVALFLAIVWGFTLVPSGWLENLTAWASSGALGALGFSSSWGVAEGGPYLSLQGERQLVTVIIIRECTAINVFAVVVGLVMTLRGGSWTRKALSIVFSAALLLVMNVSRIVLTIVLTGFSFPPFSWFFSNPTVEVYHYPISFLYGVLGVALLVVVLSRWFVPELGYTLIGIIDSVIDLIRGSISGVSRSGDPEKGEDEGSVG
jgi:exosortase/archaeosortase family protein